MGEDASVYTSESMAMDQDTVEGGLAFEVTMHLEGSDAIGLGPHPVVPIAEPELDRARATLPSSPLVSQHDKEVGSSSAIMPVLSAPQAGMPRMLDDSLKANTWLELMV